MSQIKSEKTGRWKFFSFFISTRPETKLSRMFFSVWLHFQFSAAIETLKGKTIPDKASGRDLNPGKGKLNGLYTVDSSFIEK